MARRRGWGWNNKNGVLMLEVNGVPVRMYGDYGTEKLNSASDVFDVPFGTPLQLPDGRVYRYALAGEALAAGFLCQDPLAVANEDMDLAVQAAGTVGDSTISVTTAGAVAVNLYKDGYIYVNDGAGEGHIYRVKGNTVTTGAATMTVTLADGETVKEALATATSLVGLKKNPYNGSLVYNIAEDGIPRGVASTEVTNAYYCFLQTWGDAAVLINSTVVLGKALAPGTTTTGSLDAMPIAMTWVATTVADTYTDGDKISVAWAASPIGATTDYGHVFLTIAP